MHETKSFFLSLVFFLFFLRFLKLPAEASVLRQLVYSSFHFFSKGVVLCLFFSFTRRDFFKSSKQRPLRETGGRRKDPLGESIDSFSSKERKEEEAQDKARKKE